MKKIIYSLLAVLLLIPFGVNAADYAVDYPRYNDENIDVTFYCEGSELIGTSSQTCNVILGKKEAEKELKITISTSDPLKFKYNGEEKSSLEIIAQENTDRQDFAFEVKSEGEPLKEATVTINVNITYDNQPIICEDIATKTFTLKPTGTKPSEPEQPTTPKEEDKKPTTSENKTSSQKVTNPNTADTNILFLIVIGLLSMCTIGITYKKVRQR